MTAAASPALLRRCLQRDRHAWREPPIMSMTNESQGERSRITRLHPSGNLQNATELQNSVVTLCRNLSYRRRQYLLKPF
ncbi:hypothetical protein [Azospirillum argentinense]